MDSGRVSHSPVIVGADINSSSSSRLLQIQYDPRRRCNTDAPGPYKGHGVAQHTCTLIFAYSSHTLNNLS